MIKSGRHFYETMEPKIFNPNEHQDELASKIVVGLERISEVFKVMLWEKAKNIGLSPIQIQLLIFVAYHKNELCNVSSLAKEFNVTKPTISDAIKVLVKKDLLIKDYSLADSRSYAIHLSAKGTQVVKDTESFANPMRGNLETLNQADLEQLYSTLSKFIYQLNRSGLLSVQRTCFGCSFYEMKNRSHHCNLLKKDLFDKDIRLDCPEYEERSA